MSGKITSYKNLAVWQKSVALTIRAYAVTRGFPREEIYGLTSQTRRAATSIAANIAEGSSRGHRKEYVNFLRIARELRYLNPSEYTKMNEHLGEIMRMLNGLIRVLNDQSRSGPVPSAQSLVPSP